MNLVSLILTIVFGVIGLFAFLYAIRESKKAKAAEIELSEIRQAMTSYKYLKERALELYSKGSYEESLDVFRKYLMDNKDDKEWSEILVYIFRNETIKIFSIAIPLADDFKLDIAFLFQIYISFEGILEKSSPYPQIIKTLYENFSKSFDQKKYGIQTMIAIFDKDWEAVSESIKNIRFHREDEISGSFRKYLNAFINNKRGIKDDDGWSDDIPF
jgi:type II secretory pathway pseudopilin PulG